jgi:hypothetical protein
MATTLEQVAAFMESEGLRFKIDDGVIRTGFQTPHYRDTDGDPGIPLVIRLEEDGEFIKVIAPNLYSYPDGPHKAALFQTLLMTSWDTKMIQYEYDARDGEVRAIIEFPLEDAPLTAKQLMRCLHGIAGLVDESHEKVVAAMENGKVPDTDDGGGMAELWREFQAFLEAKQQAEGGQDHGLPS